MRLYNKSKYIMRSIICLMLLGLSITITAQTMGKQTAAQLDESPAGSKILWFIDSVNGGKPVSEGDIKSYFAPKLIDKVGSGELQNMITELQENEGSMTIYKARRVKVTEYKITALGSKSGEWLVMQFYFEDSNPYRMLGFTIDSAEGMVEAEPIYPTKN